jgi:mannose-6-phosphate isomerase-like protein (cupin superfamily)
MRGAWQISPRTHRNYHRRMTDSALTRTALDLDSDDRLVSLRRPLEASGFGLNLLLLRPGQRGRVHSHTRQEEVFLVWDGTLTLIVDGEPHELARGELARVGPDVRRQLVNRGPGRLAIIAMGGTPGAHEGRDGVVWASWDDVEPAGAPQDIPLPEDLPESELRR